MEHKGRSIFALTAAVMAVGAAPAAAETVYGVTGGGTPQLVTFDSASPGTIQRSVTITGVAAGIAGIDVRPATNRITLLDNAGQLYTLDEVTGAATAVGAGTGIAGATDIDFNPTVDRVRVLGPGVGNARANPNNGAAVDTDPGTVGTQLDGDLAFAGGDANAGDTPVVPATAYVNSFPASQAYPNAPATTQFDLEAGNDVLVRQAPPNAGTLNTVGPLGVDLQGDAGFDVVTDADGTTNRAYASFAAAGAAGTALYTINTTSGAATKVGDFPAATQVVDIAVAPAPPLLAVLRDAGLGGQQLAFVSANRPQDAGETAVPISGLPTGVSITDIDQRPATGALYGLGSDGRLYTIALPSGTANAVATINPAPSGAAYGFDFNPTVDRIRIVSDTGQNLRVNPDTGAATVDGALNQGGVNPFSGVTAAGYTNSVRGATATTLFDVDSATDTLKLQQPPNDGTLVDVGPLNQAVSAEDGFDIAPRFNQGFATGDATLGGTNLLAVNVAASPITPAPAPPAPSVTAANGGAVVVGRLAGNRTVRGLAVYDPAAVVATPANPGTPPTTPGTTPPATPGTPSVTGKGRSRISYRVSPKRDRKAPFRYTISGRIVPRDGVSATGAFTKGRVTVRVKRSGSTKTLRTKSARVSSTGRFRIRVTAPGKGLKKRGSGVVRLNLRFNGTDKLFPSRAFARARYR